MNRKTHLTLNPPKDHQENAQKRLSDIIGSPRITISSRKEKSSFLFGEVVDFAHKFSFYAYQSKTSF